MPKVYNKHHKDAPKDAIYVGRPTIWGNPFVVNKDGNRLEVIEKYKAYAATLVDDIKRELKGKDLVCWCAPKPCHADVLLEIANSE